MSSGLPTAEPRPTVENHPYWEGTAQGRLVLPRCTACGTVIWYPRAFCSSCRGTDVEWFEASGRGTIYSFTISHRGQGPWRDVAPYVVAYVELEEGPRVLTNVVGCDPDEVKVAQPVEAVFEPAGEYALLRFAPAGTTS
ncbi:MAG TPA: Zn-ribbon domain-containing OB-fold protein [Acidimicrobiales bacterium]|nr:Zn-ribbon domain-containing OB-fold protein [Acidimicrobiales bacterium]